MVDGLPDAEVASVLSAIELRELELLSWGAHHGRFSLDELRSIVQAQAAHDSGDVLDALLDRGLVFEVPGGGYRSRMAETVRMLATLRQTFRTRPWWQAPELVLDYRVVHRPRRRPSRDRKQDELIAAATVGYSAGAVRALQAICPAEVAGFQVRSAEAMRAAVARDTDAGVVISAGTSSGKTLAFYLPAVAWIADSIDRDSRAHVRVLAIYPRNELLKDQLKTALDHSLRLTASGQLKGRPLRVGAWFGAVPTAANWVAQGWSGWRRRGPRDSPHGWECPYLDCPTCERPLLWQAADVAKGTERLVCDESSCGFVLDSNRIALTRNAAIQHAPDIMFTTTESLNRQLASPDTHPAFGLSGSGRARMILLDEVHTYEGTTGAQNAFLLRRVRHALGPRPILWAGLSATLLRAQEFFADFVGVRTEDVAVAEPHATELEEAGAEYLIALRHNPASVTGPLSATIQTAMALQRCLDIGSPNDDDPFGPPALDSNDLFGSRTFVFTDKLDVTNRLYWDLLDAEGWWDEGKPRQKRVPSTLAHLRSSNQPRLKAALRDPKEDRLEDGQWWWMPEQLGHDLDADRQLRVGRTSSQDRGVSDADVIVATATLEVGYDDDRVGAVIQHKAPHDAARFLQRKGRAGRKMPMRPWTGVVLSDWGRDRFAWQAYDQLFDPQLEASRLPTTNRYVRRMQAVYSMLDWLGQQVRLKRPDRNVWADLAGPADVVEKRSPDRALRRKERQEHHERILAEVLDGGPARGRLLDHLERALRLSADEVESLLWTPPRSLLLAVVPTMHRRLKQQWAGEFPHPDDSRVRSRMPLTEFVAGNLFDELLTPEVAVRLPHVSVDQPESQDESLPTFRILREFLPGNVTRHFGVRTFDRRHWLPIPDATADGRRVVDVASYGGEFLRTISAQMTEVAIFRPTRLALEQPPEEVADSTSSAPVWEVRLEPVGTGSQVELPPAWQELLPEVRFHMHAEGDGVRVCRYTRRSVGVLRGMRQQAFFTVEFEASDEGLEGVALGAEFEADAVVLRVTVPPPLGTPSAMERSLRLADTAHSDPELNYLNWATRTALVSALLLDVAESGGADEVVAKSDHALASSLARALFRLGLLDRAETSGDVDTDDDVDEQLRDLRGLVTQSSVLARLRAAVAAAGLSERDEAWLDWHRRRIGAAVGALFVDAASQLVSSFDPSEVTIDLDSTAGPVRSNEIMVWVTEQSPGGNGLVESLFAEVTASSVELRRLLSLAAEPSDLELLELELRSLMGARHPVVMHAIDELRTSWQHGHSSVSKALEALRMASMSRGSAELSKTAVSFISTRIAGPGAPPDLISLLADLLANWDRVEQQSGFAIDARTFGAICDQDDSLDGRLGRTLDDPRRRARMIAGLFWPRSLDVSGAVQLPGAVFGQLPVPASDLLRAWVPAPWPVVDCDTAEAVPTVLATGLASHGALALRFPDAAMARAATRTALEEPIEVGSLFVYPRVLSVATTARGVEVVVTAPEVDI
jgi:DEAD/DEAH box helicase/Helicase conserved C-terminal domain